ncbi:lasso peptide biosynthesis B2 protein [Sphingomonas koreensis]
MGLVLRDGVSFCETSGRLLFLDVPRDRYFCLAAPAEGAFARLVRRETIAGDQAIQARLAAQGLLISVPGDRVPAPCAVPMPSSGVLDKADEELPVSAPIAAVAALARAEFGLRLFGLRRALHSVARRKAQVRPESLLTDAGIAAPARAFHAAALLASPLDHCLPRSLATARHYLSLGITVDLVLGVKIQPFAAHCWVQRGPLLLNDRIDTVRNFSPILAI